MVYTVCSPLFKPLVLSRPSSPIQVNSSINHYISIVLHLDLSIVTSYLDLTTDKRELLLGFYLSSSFSNSLLGDLVNPTDLLQRCFPQFRSHRSPILCDQRKLVIFYANVSFDSILDRDLFKQTICLADHLYEAR